MIGLAEAVISEAKVVGDLCVGGIPRLKGLEIVFGLVIAQQTSRQAAGCLSGAEALGKLGQRCLVVFEGVKISAVQLIVLAQLNPDVDTSLVRFRSSVRRLGTNMDFRFRRRIVFAFGLAQKCSTLRILNLKGVFRLCVDTWNLVGPSVLGDHVDLLPKD